MQGGTNFLLRFIDLGLLLLMAFFAIADLREPFQSPLPQTGPNDGNDAPVTLYHMQFGRHVVANIYDSNDTPVCHAASFTVLQSCLAELGTGNNVVFLLVPLPLTTVQNFIHIMDICTSTGVECLPPRLD